MPRAEGEHNFKVWDPVSVGRYSGVIIAVGRKAGTFNVTIPSQQHTRANVPWTELKHRCLTFAMDARIKEMKKASKKKAA